MRYIKTLNLMCLVLFGIMPSCVKNTATIEYRGSYNKPTVILPDSTIKKGESFVVSTTVPDSNSIIRWSIQPSDSTSIIANGNQATVHISLAGTYLITANFYSPADPVNPYDSSHSTIVVKDSANKPPVPPVRDYDTLSLVGDQLIISPDFFLNGALFLTVTTTNVFACKSYLSIYSTSQERPGPNSSFTMNFNSGIVAVSTSDCTGTSGPASNQIDIVDLPIGVHPIFASLNQIDYQGSVNVTDSNYTFTWNYTSGITISPLQIKTK